MVVASAEKKEDDRLSGQVTLPILFVRTRPSARHIDNHKTFISLCRTSHDHFVLPDFSIPYRFLSPSSPSCSHSIFHCGRYILGLSGPSHPSSPLFYSPIPRMAINLLNATELYSERGGEKNIFNPNPCLPKFPSDWGLIVKGARHTPK